MPENSTISPVCCKSISLWGMTLLKIKKYENREIFTLFGILPVFSRPVIKTDENTFVVWEPCSQSHSEVVPGYAKYLLDLGYSVSIVVKPEHYHSGLFSRFSSVFFYFRAVKLHFYFCSVSV